MLMRDFGHAGGAAGLEDRRSACRRSPSGTQRRTGPPRSHSSSKKPKLVEVGVALHVLARVEAARASRSRARRACRSPGRSARPRPRAPRRPGSVAASACFALDRSGHGGAQEDLPVGMRLIRVLYPIPALPVGRLTSYCMSSRPRLWPAVLIVALGATAIAGAWLLRRQHPPVSRAQDARDLDPDPGGLAGLAGLLLAAARAGASRRGGRALPSPWGWARRSFAFAA